jgi:predicted HTH transcriptional regulator
MSVSKNILDVIKAGETSRVQFKRELDNQDKLAAEMIAFSNAKGGIILFGVEEIKYGNPVIRNNQIVAFAIRTLPFSGLGTGIKRALELHPNIELINDTEGEQFIAKIYRESTIIG